MAFSCFVLFKEPVAFLNLGATRQGHTRSIAPEGKEEAHVLSRAPCGGTGNDAFSGDARNDRIVQIRSSGGLQNGKFFQCSRRIDVQRKFHRKFSVHSLRDLDVGSGPVHDFFGVAALLRLFDRLGRGPERRTVRGQGDEDLSNGSVWRLPEGPCVQGGLAGGVVKLCVAGIFYRFAIQGTTVAARCGGKW